MCTIRLDIGSSSVKAAILDVKTGRSLTASHSPRQEVAINALVQGFAKQDPKTR